MTALKVSTSGFRELETALAELPKSTGKNVLRRAGRNALGPILTAAKNAAPVDEGDLRNSITIKNSKAKRQAGSVKFDPSTGVALDMGPVGRQEGGNAAWQEFGTVKSAAHPFMRPAWDGGKDAALVSLRTEIGLQISKAATRLARKAAKGK